MAEIVVMKKWRDTHPERVSVRHSERLEKRPVAELVLFLGVRYERIGELTHRAMDEMALRIDTH